MSKTTAAKHRRGPPYESRVDEAAVKMARISHAIHTGWYEGQYATTRVPVLGPFFKSIWLTFKAFFKTAFQLFREDWNS
jgi:hypothetical protein